MFEDPSQIARPTGQSVGEPGCKDIFLKLLICQNGHFMRFYHQNVASHIFALLSVIKRQMSPFDPFKQREIWLQAVLTPQQYGFLGKRKKWEKNCSGYVPK